MRPLLAGLFALLASGCVSSRPWRACAPPCEGPQIEQAARVAVLRKDRVTSYLKHVHWSADRESLVGSGKSRVGRPAAPVVVPRSEICALFTQRVEPGRVAENAVLVPLAVAGEILFEILAGVIHAEVEHADWPPPKSELYFPRTCADWARLPAVPVAPPP